MNNYNEEEMKQDLNAFFGHDHHYEMNENLKTVV